MAKLQTTLVLQGGGALGSYQAGVYAAMAAHDCRPGWVAGTSIGAINAALIAGNAAGNRIAALRAFWEAITAPTALWPRATDSRLAAAAALLGQPGFYKPRSPLDWLMPDNVTSYYDTGPLRETLERLVDFDRVNARETRLSVGAVNVRTGRLVYFDNKTTRIGPEHIMASGALPPGFPPVEIAGELYWDGGVVSNTPLQYVIDDVPRQSQLCISVDLFHANGEVPTNLEEVSEREKDIRYASRTRHGARAAGNVQELRHAIADLLELLPDDIRNTRQARRLQSHACPNTLDIAHLIYRPLVPQGSAKDYEFSRTTMEARWEQGRLDAEETLTVAPWTAPRGDSTGVRIFDVAHDRLVGAPVAPQR